MTFHIEVKEKFLEFFFFYDFLDYDEASEHGWGQNHDNIMQKLYMLCLNFGFLKGDYTEGMAV